MTTLSRIYGSGSNMTLLSPKRQTGSSPVKQGSIPVCTVLAPLNFMKNARITDLKTFDFWEKVFVQIKSILLEAKEEAEAIKMINSELTQCDEHILPPTEFIKRLDGNDKVPAYEVFMLYIIAVYYSNKHLAVQCTDTDCKNKLLDFLREKIMDELMTREQRLTEGNPRPEDTELTYFKQYGTHKKDHFPPFLLHEVIGLRQDELDAKKTWRDFKKTKAGRAVIAFNNKEDLQSEIVQKILKHTTNESKLGCKGGMMLVQYVVPNNEDSFFRHAVCFTIHTNQTIQMHDTLGNVRENKEFNNWIESPIPLYSENYDAKYILGVYALFHVQDDNDGDKQSAARGTNQAAASGSKRSRPPETRNSKWSKQLEPRPTRNSKR